MNDSTCKSLVKDPQKELDKDVKLLLLTNLKSLLRNIIFEYEKMYSIPE